MESIYLNSFVLLEHLAMLLTSTLAIKCELRNFLNKTIGIINFEKPFLNFIDDTMILYLNSKLDINLSCAKDFRNLISMVTWCINWRGSLALIIFQGSSLKLFPIMKRLAITLVYCSRVHAWWSTQSRLATLLSSLIARRWVRLQTLWWFWLKDFSIDEMVGAWYFGCLSGPQGLPVGFLLLWYSVSFTVESLSLLHLLVISWLVCYGRWCIDKLGVFHANQISMCFDPHLN